jgi:hypothetical protein
MIRKIAKKNLFASELLAGIAEQRERFATSSCSR